MRTLATKARAINQYNGLGNQLWDLAGNRPSLDLRFADEKSLVDATTGTNLVDHTRASSGTYVGSDGLIKTATTNYFLNSETFATTWNRTGILAFGSGSTEDAIAAPNGSITADFLGEDTSTGRHRISSGISFVAGVTYTLSIFAKSSNRNIYINAGVAFGGSAGFNLQTGTVAVNTGSASIENVGNGWYRCSVSGTASSTATPSIFFQIQTGVIDENYTGDGTSGIYIWGAQLEQSSTVGEYIPTTSTINSAPRFNHDPTTGESLGLLVEESRTNLLLRSEEFQTTWTPTNTTVSVNQIVAPDGAVTADKILEAATTSEHNIRQDTASQPAGTYTVSIFAKAAERDVVQFVSTGVLGGFRANFDLANGVLGSVDAQLTASIVPFANGWYRCIVTTTSTTSGTLRAQWNIVTSPTSARVESYLGDVSKGLYIWGAQLEAGSFPTSYIKNVDNSLGVTRAADVADISGNNFGAFNLLQYSEEFEQSYWAKTNATVITNSIANPLTGKFTADTLVATANSGSHYVNRSITSSANSTVSVYAKAAGYNYIEVNGYKNSVDQNRVTVDLTNGTVANNTNSLPVSVTSAGNGWYRIAVTLTNGGSYATFAISADGTVNDTFTGDGTSGIYIWGAQLEESSTATPYIKSDVTWNSRASNATYYDSTGTIRKSSYNLLARSEEFDQWQYLGVTLTADAIEAPDGTLTAEKVEGVNTTTSLLYRAFTSALANTTYTFSFWIKSVDGSSGTWGVNYYNGSSHNRTTVPVTGEWNRVSVQFSNLSAVSNNIYIADNREGLADLTEAYVWGAQLETGTYAGDYVKTEASAASSARTNAYLPDGSGNFVSAGELLLEDAGTNLLLRSEEFDDASWNSTAFGARAVTANQTTAPDGTITADLITADGSLAPHFVSQAITLSSIPYSYSVYAKANTHNFLQLRGFNAFGSPYANFDISTGMLGDTGGSATGSTIENVGNGWYRCTMFITPTAASASVAIYIVDSNTAGSGQQNELTTSFYLWGAQLEASPYPTSYIPTAGSQVTRAADVSTSSSNTFGNSWYRQDEGSAFVDFTVNGVTAGANHFVYDFSDGTINEEIFLNYQPSENARWVARVSSNQVTQDSLGSSLDRVKHAFGMISDDYMAARDGVLSTGSSQPGMPAINSLKLGARFNESFPYNGTIRRLCYWNQRLPNSTLSTITQ